MPTRTVIYKGNLARRCACTMFINLILFGCGVHSVHLVWTLRTAANYSSLDFSSYSFISVQCPAEMHIIMIFSGTYVTWMAFTENCYDRRQYFNVYINR